jgi:hypothetical protein
MDRRMACLSYAVLDRSCGQGRSNYSRWVVIE